MTEGTKLVAIYGLYDPRTEALRYIGKTIKPKQRLAQHCRSKADQAHTPVVIWCKSLRALGLQPRMDILTWCSDWEMAEKRLIAAHRRAGADLLNVAAGGIDVPPGKGGSVKSHCPTNPLYRAAMAELARARRITCEDSPWMGIAFDRWMRNIRIVRNKLLRAGMVAFAVRFDLNLWADLVNHEPIDWHMSNMRDVKHRNPADKARAILDVRDELIRHGLLAA